MIRKHCLRTDTDLQITASHLIIDDNAPKAVSGQEF